MSNPPKRLGRGLESLISRLTDSPERHPDTARDDFGEPQRDLVLPSEGTSFGKSLPIDDLVPNPFQPRSNANNDNVLSLARSIKQSGILQPIAVRPAGDHFEIIAGERRWRAAKSVGFAEVPVVVRAADDQQMLELALIENIQREDLNAIDRARAYRQFASAFGLNNEEIAERVGEDRSTVANYVRLLDLQPEIQASVANGTLSMGHARCLLGIPDEDRRLRLAESVEENELSVRALEEIVRRERVRQNVEGSSPDPSKRRRSAHVGDLERRLEEAIRTKVLIREGKKKGTGRIIINYYSLDEFDRIAAVLGVEPE